MRASPKLLLFLVIAVSPTQVRAEGLDALNATQDQATVYAMGLLQARELHALNLTDEEFALYAEGMRDGFAREPKLTLDSWVGPALSARRGRERARIVEERRASEVFLGHAEAEPGARRLASGLVYTELKRGSGARPGVDSVVTLHFHGTLRDGMVVESSVSRDEPVRTRLSQAIPCWQQGLQLVRAGGKAKLVCPASLAYGDDPPSPLITPGAVITYEIELREVR